MIITLTKSKAAIADYQNIISAESNGLRDTLASMLEAAATAGVLDGGQWVEREVLGTVKNSAEFSFDWTTANADAVQWAFWNVGELITGINRTTVEAIQSDVAEWIENGETLGALTNRLQGKYTFSRARAKLIASTEITRAYAEGNVTAWKESGVVEGVQVVTANDERVCPVCAPLGGLSYDPKGGAIAASVAQQSSSGARAKLGESFIHPGGAGLAGKYAGRPFRSPPFHPGCRCSLSPVILMAAPAEPPTAPAAAPQPQPTQPTLFGSAEPAPALIELGGQAAQGAPIPARAPAPAGPSVSKSITYGRGKLTPAIDEALAAIDSVHGDGQLSAIPIRPSSARNYAGRYRFRPASAFGPEQAVDIEISRMGPHPQTTIAHEIGHWLEGVAHDDKFYNSAELKQALNSSEAIQTLRDMKRRPNDYTITKTVQTRNGPVSFTRTPDGPYMDYLLKDYEIWARAYAQYISTRSGNATMIAQIAEEVDDLLYGAQQWAAADFEPIAAAIDDIFEQKGWITR